MASTVNQKKHNQIVENSGETATNKKLAANNYPSFSTTRTNHNEILDNIADTTLPTENSGTTTSAINKLLSSAQEIILAIENLYNGNISSLKLQPLTFFLDKKIEEFSQLAYSYGYNNQTIKSSRYLLSKLLDHSLQNNPNLTNSNYLGTWKEDYFFNKHSSTTDANEFYKILLHALENNQQYIDFLELAFIGFQFGFTGDNQADAEKNQAIQQAIYDKIRHQHGMKRHIFTAVDTPQLATASRLPRLKLWQKITIAALLITPPLLAVAMHLNLRHTDKKISATISYQQHPRVISTQTTAPNGTLASKPIAKG